MKHLLLLLSISVVGLFASCDKSGLSLNNLCTDDVKVEMTIPTSNEILLQLPACFSVVPLQGIDSFVGRIEAPSQGLEIRYDIGGLSGQYVSETSPIQTTVQGDFEEFRYHIRDGRLTFTFPDAGPANFITEQVLFVDDLIEIFKTLRVQ